MAYATLGTISHGTLRSEDLIEAFWNELEYQIGRFDWFADSTIQDRDKMVTKLWDISESVWPNDNGEMTDDESVLEDSIEELTDLLNFFAGPYRYFGAHTGDGSDFGYWPSMEAIDELPQFDEIPDELPGEDFAVVSDHGNVSVYNPTGKLIFDFV